MNDATMRSITSLFLSGALVLATVAATLGADDDEAPPLQIESLKGHKVRMANTKMADRVTRVADASGDQASAAGSPAPDAPPWTDIVSVTFAPIELPPKLMTKMANSYPPGASGAFYGAQADWQKGDEGVFVAVEMAKKLAGDAAQQVEVGLGGEGATPMQAGAYLDTHAGVADFSLSGVFSNGAFGTGTTDVRGREFGGPIEYYNTESGVFGFYDRKRSTWNLIMPRSADTDSLVVSVRSSTPEGEVFDRLELPGGGHFADLADPEAGWDKKSELPPLECRSLETFSADSGVTLSDPSNTLIRYTAGMDAEGDPEQAAALLGPAIDVMGTLPVALSAAGAEAPTTVEAELSVAPRGNAVSMTLEAPPGVWSFALADEQELLTPAGERIIDHGSLTGAAGVRTGAGLDGLVAGDLSCAIDGSEPPAAADPEAEPSAVAATDPPAEAGEDASSDEPEA